jgi:hypothetical protein
MTTKDTWIAFSNDLMHASYDVLANAQLTITEKGAGDPKILTVLLLARTISNFKGVLLTAENGRVVESRILTRSCFENYLWIAGLVSDGDKFAQRMLHDEIQSRQARGQMLFDGEATRNSLDPDTGANLRQWLAESRRRHSEAKSLNPKEVASKVTGGEAYIFYSQLSADSAHPSLSALNRLVRSWVENGEEVRGIELEPTATETELAETLNLACLALLGAAIGTNQILEGSVRLNAIASRYDALAKS